jgi:hypothetical protein
MRRFPWLALIPILVAACGDSEERLDVARDAPPAAAVLTPGMERVSLVDQLRGLEAELERTEAGNGDRLLRAEAISDRLIHADRPVDWLAAGYDVEARLRQLQALADRVVARLRRGATLEAVSEDIHAMRLAVEDLLAQLAVEGGGQAPPTLDSLLAQDPLRDVQSASLSAVVAARDSAQAEQEPLPDIEPQVEPVQSEGALGQPVQPLPDTTPRPR